MMLSEGLRLNQTLPFNVSPSNTIFLFNCSPRLFVSPLNCTPSSLCHRYLESSGHLDSNRAVQCASSVNPCCTFVAGGMPSAYKIRLHSSGCKSFRSILHIDPSRPASQWKEGLEIQWAPPPEKGKREVALGIKILIGAISFVCLAVVTAATIVWSRKWSNWAKLAEARGDLMRISNGEKAARMVLLKEVKKATKNFSRDNFLGSGGYGEVYKGKLQDGTVVAVKMAKVGNLKSIQQVLNEVGILSQVKHKNLVTLLGCCLEGDQALMIYEYISNGTLHDHLHGKFSTFLSWRTRLKIAAQTGEALAYLHSGVATPIYHRDVKTTNILLDDAFNVKVADFGLSTVWRRPARAFNFSESHRLLTGSRRC